jgi:hypothetical protein
VTSQRKAVGGERSLTVGPRSRKGRAVPTQCLMSPVAGTGGAARGQSSGSSSYEALGIIHVLSRHIWHRSCPCAIGNSAPPQVGGGCGWGRGSAWGWGGAGCLRVAEPYSGAAGVPRGAGVACLGPGRASQRFGSSVRASGTRVVRNNIANDCSELSALLIIRYMSETRSGSGLIRGSADADQYHSPVQRRHPQGDKGKQRRPGPPPPMGRAGSHGIRPDCGSPVVALRGLKLQFEYGKEIKVPEDTVVRQGSCGFGLKGDCSANGWIGVENRRGMHQWVVKGYQPQGSPPALCVASIHASEPRPDCV